MEMFFTSFCTRLNMWAKRLVVGVAVLCWASGWAQFETGIQRSDWKARFAEPIAQSLKVAWDGLVDFRVHDFDGDGATDLVFADGRGLWVCWGAAGNGLEEAYRLLDERGTIDQIDFEHVHGHEDYPALLWLKKAIGPELFELSAYRFDERDFVPFRNLSMNVRGSLRCTGNGLIVGEGESGQLMLERHGAMLHLGDLKGHVEDLDFVDLNEDGLEDVVVQQGGRLRVALGTASGGMGPWHEAGDQDIDAWDVAVDLEGKKGVMFRASKSPYYSFWSFGPHARTPVVVEINSRADIINQHSTQFDGTVLLHDPVTSALYVVPFMENGRDFGTQVLAELEPNSIIRVSDWDGDGDDDVVALHEGNRTLIWVPYVGPSDCALPRWSRAVLQTLEDSLSAEFTGQVQVSNQWRRDVDWSPEIQEWVVASSGIWGVGRSTAVRNVWSSEQRPAPAVIEQSGELEACVDIGFLVYDERADQCLKMDHNRDWHRLTYSRDEDGRTFVVIDRELRFDGITEGVRFDHRMLHLGACFGTTWRSYGAWELDDVGLYRGSLGPEQMLNWQRSGVAPVGLERALGFDFEGDEPDLPLDGGQVLNIDHGAEIVKVDRGMVLRLDGTEGRAHGFVDVPEREVVFDIQFKATGEVDELEVFASLYGMYTLNFALRPGRPQPGVVTSPSNFQWMHAQDSRGGYLMTHRGKVMRMLPSGEFLVPTAEGWDLMKSKALPFGWAHAAPWVQDGVAYAVFGNRGKIWRCLGPEYGWEEFQQLNRSLAAFDHVVSTGQWALIWNEDRSIFGWLDVEQGAFYDQTTAVVPDAPQAVRPGRGGVEFMDSRGKWWLVEAPMKQAIHEGAFRSGHPWLWGMTAFACASVFGLFTVRFRRKNGLTKSEEDMHIEAAVAYTLNQLRPRAGESIDADELDALLGIEAIDTPETRRSRRNRAVNDLNAWSLESRGHEWVKRTRDAQDRRRALYELSGDMRNCCLESAETT